MVRKAYELEDGSGHYRSASNSDVERRNVSAVVGGYITEVAGPLRVAAHLSAMQPTDWRYYSRIYADPHNP